MRPYVICHMLSSVDGKIDGAAPGIDGRRGIPAVFDGLNPARKAAVPLQLKSVEQRENGTLWVRYEVKRGS